MADERPRIPVPVSAPTVDGVGQVGHAEVGGAPEPFRGQFREPALDRFIQEL